MKFMTSKIFQFGDQSFDDQDFIFGEAEPNYDNSQGWHLYLVTENRELLEGCNRVLDECFTTEEIRTRKKRGAARKVTRKLVMSLYKEWEADPNKFITVSLNNNDWARKGRYGKLGLSLVVINRVLKKLEENGFIHFRRGDTTWNEENRKQSRVRAEPKLIELIHASKTEGNAIQQRIRGDNTRYRVEKFRPRTILKDTKKKPMVILRKPSEVIQGEELLERYQELLDRTEIFNPATGELIQPYDKFQYRVFSNSRFDHNGRVHGGFWQNIKRELRSQILLDGRETEEVDIKGTFPVMVYHFLDIDYWQEFTEETLYKSDPYYLEGYTDDEEFGSAYRKILKVIFNSAINTTNEGKNIGWLTKIARKEAKEKAQATPPEISVEAAERICRTAPEFIPKFLFERHYRLKDYFFDEDVGMQAMHIESKIAMKVINEFVAMDSPVLTVFDSYIVKAEYKELLMEVIVNCYWRTLGFAPFLQ